VEQIKINGILNIQYFHSVPTDDLEIIIIMVRGKGIMRRIYINE
jgi:hypothetical protein